MLVNSQVDHQRNQTGNINKIPRDKWKQKLYDPKPMWCSKSSSKRKVYSNTNLPRETRTISSNISVVLSLCLVQLFATPWTAVHQAPLSIGILQARILEWVAILLSRGSSWRRYWTQVSCILGRFTIWATREAIHLKRLEKEKQTKPKVSRMKEIIEIRAEISEIENKKAKKN